MQTVVVSASKARKNFFDLLTATQYENQITIITKNNKVSAKIVPCGDDLFDWDKYKKSLKKIDKILSESDWSDLNKVRKDFKAKRHPQW